MASQIAGVCAACHRPTTTLCGGCRDAPDYLPGDAPNTYYCDQDCQKQVRDAHKDSCRRMGRRIALHRASQILKTALLTYREMVYDLDLTKIESRDGTLWLHQKLKARPMRCVFPGHLTDNNDHKEAALLANQCTTAMALSCRLIRKLFSGVLVLFETVDLLVGKPKLPAKLTPAPDSGNVPHTIIIATWSSAGERWVIDTTGCQYGFKDILVPFDKYVKDNGCRLVCEATTYNWTETKDLDFYAMLPRMNATRLQKQDREVERKARLHFAKFVDAEATPKILKGSLQTFEEKLHSFEVDLRSHMQRINT